MNGQHYLLLILWILYALLHSLLAATPVKRFMQQIMGGKYRYYRFGYSCFALAGLIGVLYVHFALNSPLLWQAPFLQRVIAVLTGIAGVTIMLICARVYFAEMMGLYAFSRQPENIGLVQTGLHKYIRHPLYTGTLLLFWAFFIYQPLLKNLLTCTVNTLYVFIGIQLEERKLIRAFGDAYRRYAASTPMLFPKLSSKA